MIVLFIQTAMYPYFVGGAEIFDYYLIQKLQDSFKVEYLSYKKQTKFPISGHIIPEVFPKRFFTPLLLFFKIYLIKKNVKIIHIRFSRSTWLNWWPYPLLKKLFGIPYIITIHGGGLMKWRFKLPYSMLFKHASKIFGVSERICAEYIKRTGISIQQIDPLIPFTLCGVDSVDLREKYKLPKDAFVFSFVGSLKNLKNPGLLLDALQIIGEEYVKRKQIVVLFAGDGPLKKTLQDQIKNTFFNKNVIIGGNISRESIPEIYKLSNAYVIASDFEGTPISLLEAMFNKLPIIASNSPGINNIIQNQVNGYLFKNKDAIDLSRQMIRLIENPNAAEMIARNASNNFQERFSYQKVLSQYEKAITEAR